MGSLELRSHCGWFAGLADGLFLKEGEDDWDDVVEQMGKVVTVGLVKDGRIFSLPPGHREYIQAKSATAVLGSNEVQVLSRYVGYRQGSQVIRIRVMEDTNDVTLEIVGLS